MADSKVEEISHNSLIAKAKELMDVLFGDPFLADVAQDCSAEDARYQLALVQGKAITVHIHKQDGDVACKCLARTYGILPYMHRTRYACG